MKKNLLDNESENPLNEWPKNGLEFLKACPVCNQSSNKILYNNLRDRIFFCAPGSWTMFQCTRCGVAYLNPRPNQETIGLAYKNYYTHLGLQRQKPEDLTGFSFVRRSLANGYRNWRYGSRLKPSCKLGLLFVFFPPWREILDVDLRFLPKWKPGANVLDIGCGNGMFLKLAKEVGWNAYGADPDPQARLIGQAEGIEIRQGGIESFSEKENFFEVITLSHVIEHVPDPVKLIAECLKLLKPGGQLYIDTPNIQSFGHRTFGRNWFHLDPPRHLTIFNWRALEHTLLRLGYIKLKRKLRTLVFASSLSGSEAIRLRKSPLSFYNHPQLKYWVKGYLASFLSHFNYEQSEFITLLAFKPK